MRSILLSPAIIENHVIENNLYHGNTLNFEGITDLIGTQGNFSADPLFTDIVSGDFHLLPGSPAIDTGIPLGAPSIDFSGTARPIEGNNDGSPIVDIGAFEASAQ